LAGVVFFLTPQGKGFAQELIRFFTFAESDVLLLATGQPTEAPPPTRTPALTQLVELEAVTPAVNPAGVMSYPTDTPAPTARAGEPIWNLSLEEAEQLAGFELRVPVSLAPGYRLDNVIFDPGSGEVAQFYEFHPYSAGEMFILGQRRSVPADVIGQSAQVEQLTVGDIAVEYVKGGWSGDSGLGIETWGADSIMHTFHWQDGDLYFTLVFMFDDSDTWSPAYWTKDGMQAMIEIITGQRAEFPEQVNYNNITSIAQAEEIVGFELLVPSVLPEGFVFTHVVYEPDSERAMLFYQPQEDSRAVSGVNLVIIESQDMEQSFSWEGYPQDAVEEVLIGSRPATFARGVIVDGVYDPDTNLYLVWNTTDLSIELIFWASENYPARLEKADMLAIAVSME
jgi:hypothetical protein